MVVDGSPLSTTSRRFESPTPSGEHVGGVSGGGGHTNPATGEDGLSPDADNDIGAHEAVSFGVESFT